jgi:hypothetical protein
VRAEASALLGKAPASQLVVPRLKVVEFQSLLKVYAQEIPRLHFSNFEILKSRQRLRESTGIHESDCIRDVASGKTPTITTPSTYAPCDPSAS